MRKLKLLLVGLLVALPLLALGATVKAQNFQTGTNVTVPTDKTIDSTLYTAGQTLDIAGTVNGDVFCGGQTVTISGTVTGDVICAAQTITISGKVEGNIRVAAQTLTFNGEVGRNATVAIQTFTADSKSRIGGDLTLLGQNATLNGSIGRDIAGTMESLAANGTVGRNISAEIHHLNLGTAAVVGGGIYYVSQNDLLKQDGARVGGEVKRTDPRQQHPAQQKKGLPFRVWFGLALLLIAFVLILVAPRLFNTGALIARQSMGKTFVIGLVASLVAPMVIAVAFVTVIGIPLGLLLLFAWLVIVGLAWPFAAYLTGRLIWRRGTNAILVMLFGAAVLILLCMIPFLNFFVILAILWFGIGMAMRLVWRLLGDRTYTIPPLALAPKPALAESSPKKPLKPRA
jgi:cytoskeletal protein CcmA (bactofilin family)